MGSKIRAKNCNLYEREFINFPRGASIREKGVHLNCLKRFNVQDVVGVIERWFFVIKWRKSHALEVTTITLFSSHHDPHGPPLGQVNRFDDPRDLVHKRDCASDVVQNGNVADLVGDSNIRTFDPKIHLF